MPFYLTEDLGGEDVCVCGDCLAGDHKGELDDAEPRYCSNCGVCNDAAAEAEEEAAREEDEEEENKDE